jgi:hypothetical protein
VASTGAVAYSITVRSGVVAFTSLGRPCNQHLKDSASQLMSFSMSSSHVLFYQFCLPIRKVVRYCICGWQTINTQNISTLIHYWMFMCGTQSLKSNNIVLIFLPLPSFRRAQLLEGLQPNPSPWTTSAHLRVQARMSLALMRLQPPCSLLKPSHLEWITIQGRSESASKQLMLQVQSCPSLISSFAEHALLYHLFSLRQIGFVLRDHQ